MCESFRPFLQLLRGHSTAIKNSSFFFDVSIQSGAYSQWAQQFCFPFQSHQKVLEFLSNELLPTFDSCRRYQFGITFWKDADHAKEVIVSLLGLPTVERCSNVTILFKFAGDELPSEAISHWLNFNDREGNGKERFLFIQTKNPIILGVVGHLKKVNYLYYIIFDRISFLNCSQQSFY